MKNLTKIFALMAMSVMTVALMAQTYTDEPMSVTWSMADGATSKAVASPDGTLLSQSWSYGSDVTLNSSATATVFAGKGVENVYTQFTRVGSDKLSNDISKLGNSYVEFTFTPAAGLTFTPTALDFDVVKLGTGDPNIWVEYIQGETRLYLAENMSIARDNDDTPAPHKSFDLTEKLSIVATTGAIAIRIYIGKLLNTKQLGIADLVVTGTVSGTPAAVSNYTISTAANIEAAGTVTGADTYAEGASATLNASPNTGYAFVNWTKASDSEWTSTENPITVEVIGDETYTANFKQLFTVQYGDLSSYLASSKNPLAGVFYADKNDQFTIPAYAHKYLYSANYTFVEWSDGVNTYQPGAIVTLTDNITLTPIFAATTKTLANITSEFDLTWNLRSSEIVYNSFQGANQQTYYTLTATIGGQKVSIPMIVDPTSGKVSNSGRSDQWAQVNDGTKFILPAVNGLTIVATGSSAFNTTTTIAGNPIEESMLSNNGKTLTYTYEGSAESIDLVFNGQQYLSTIVVTYPVTEVIPVEGVHITGITVDGESISFPAEINSAEEEYTATWAAENIYTSIPVVVASFSEGADETGLVSGTGTSRTYSFTKADRTFKLIINNLYVYEPTGDEEAVAIKHNEGAVENNIWTNGVYTMTTSGIGSSGGADFKFDANTDAAYTISVPADVVVKQFIIRNFHANYSGGNGQLKTVTSTGATAYIPTKCACVCNVEGSSDPNRQYEGPAYDLIVNIEDHTAGTPIVFTMVKSAQPMGWIELTTVKETLSTPPTKTAENVTVSDNDAAILVSFDREIAEDVTATIGGQQVTAKGGGSSLLFTAWDLNYSANYTLSIPASAVKDNYGNVTDAAINIAVNVPAKEEIVPAIYDYIVSNVDELNAALDAVEASNPTSNKTAARKTIFIKNGDYDLGSVMDGDNYLTVRWLNANNVSLIGESRDGVLIHGYSTGISNPVLNLRYGQGFYLQDLTVRNDFDYGTGDLKGVAVAIYGGNKTIMKNVRMLSDQDTQVTGERVYHEDCEIHGTVDFICGGGDNYYFHTDLVLENSEGIYITAPSTSSATQYGYVFDHCTIKAVDEEAAATTAGKYFLGRPWQNEPRSTFLYTDMQILSAAEGWTNMSAPLISHFYEYGTEHEGAPVNLSTRKKPSISPNEYVPVLTAEEAADFTAHNVLGGDDAWDAAAMAAQVAAPANVTLSGTVIAWDAVEDAKLYVVLKDGAYIDQTTDATYTVSANGTYTIKAANRFGGLGEASNAVQYKGTATGFEEVRRDDIQCTKVFENGVLYIMYKGTKYNVQGQIVK